MYSFSPLLLSKRRVGLILPLIAALLLSGCEKPQEAQDIRPVRALAVTAKNREEVLGVPGQVAAHRYVNASFKIGGRLVARTVSMGAAVAAGQVLAQLDNTIENNTRIAAEAEVAAAKAALEQAESVGARASELFAIKAISQNEFDEADRQLKSARAMATAAEAKAKSTREQLDYTRLTATSAGIVTDTFAEVGEMVAAGHPIVRIAETGTLDAVFDMPADFIRGGLAKGWTITLSPDENSGPTGPSLQATVTEIGPEADVITRTYPTKAEIHPPCPGLLLGATIFGRIVFAHGASIEIPASALTTAGTQPAVWVVAKPESTVQLRAIKIGEYTTGGVIVSEGLTPGEVIVTAGVQALHQGQKVRTEGERHENR